MSANGAVPPQFQKRGRWVLAIWVMCVLLSFAQGRLAGGTGPLIEDEIIQAIGGSTVIFLIPYLLLLAPSKFIKSFPFKSTPYLISLALLCLLFGLMAIIGGRHLLTTKSADSKIARIGQSPVQNGTVFQGIEYSVVFPAQPNVKSMMIPFGNKSYKGEQATLKLPGGDALVRAEKFEIPLADASLIDEKYAYEAMKQYAQANGMQHIEMEFDENTLGKVCYFRGYKTFNSPGKTPRRAIYEVRTYVGRQSMFVIYSGGAAEGYPQHGIVEFFKSVMLRGT